MILHVLLQLRCRLELLPAGLAGVGPAAGQLLAVLLHVQGQLTLQRELVPTLGADEVLLLLVQHDVGFEAGHPGELLVAHRTGRVLAIVGASVQRQVEFDIECLGALVTAMWLVILLVIPHVAVKLGLFWKRQQTDFTFMEVWNLIGIISVLRIQC